MAVNKNDKTTKVMDVSHPGKAAPPASAKPIIVTNRPMLKQDPMMATADGMEQEKSSSEAQVSRIAKPITVFAPAHDDEVAKPTGPDSAPALPPAPKAAEAALSPSPVSDQEQVVDGTGTDTLATSAAEMPSLAAEPAAESSSVIPKAIDEPAAIDAQPVPEEPADKTDEPDESSEVVPGASDKTEAATAKDEPVVPTAESSSGTSSPVVTEPSSAEPETESADGEALPDDQLAPARAAEEAKRKEEDAQAAILAEQEKIVASKRFYLPIVNTAERRGLQRVLLVLVLVIVIAAVWADVVLDAGIIHINGVHALTHFFK